MKRSAWRGSSRPDFDLSNEGEKRGSELLQKLHGEGESDEKPGSSVFPRTEIRGEERRSFGHAAEKGRILDTVEPRNERRPELERDGPAQQRAMLFRTSGRSVASPSRPQAKYVSSALRSIAA